MKKLFAINISILSNSMKIAINWIKVAKLYRNKKNKTLVLLPVRVFEGPQGHVYLPGRCTMEAPLSQRHVINLYTFISILSDNLYEFVDYLFFLL
jgi:hypothetical protein